MDNHNQWNNQQNNRDRWNSSASENSYYNQPVHEPYDRGFAYASLILGLLSTTLGCCGLALPLGAMGIIFASLCYRRKRQYMNSNARLGLYLSVFGTIYGLVMIIYTIFVQYPAMLQDPAYIEQLNQLYQSTFGMDFEEVMQSIYGSGL